MGTGTPALRTLPDLVPWVFSSGCPPISSIISLIKLVNVSVSLSSVSRSSKGWNLRRESYSQFIASLSEVQVTTWGLQLASEVGVVVWN